MAVDHFYLDDLCIFHCMDYVTRFSAIHIVPSTKLADAVAGFEACWLNQFWHPNKIQGDKAFNNGEFANYLQQLNIQFKPVPPKRHSRNPIESKHAIIRSVFIRLKENAGIESNLQQLAYQAVTTSNDLYGNNVMSSFEVAKGYTKPLIKPANELGIPDEIYQAQQNLIAKRKLALILKSKSTAEIPVKAGVWRFSRWRTDFPFFIFLFFVKINDSGEVCPSLIKPVVGRRRLIN